MVLWYISVYLFIGRCWTFIQFLQFFGVRWLKCRDFDDNKCDEQKRITNPFFFVFP